MPRIELVPAQYEISDGYIGSMGVSYEAATADTLADAIEKAAILNKKTVEEIKYLLGNGKTLAWCESPNYSYDHSYGGIRRKRTLPPVALIACDCGHSVQRAQVMSASRGSSCPDCYDRMSD